MVSTSNVISVTCDCGKRLKAPATAAGKRARCPACGKIHVMPEAQEPLDEMPVTRAAPAPVSPPPVDPFEAPPEEEDPFGESYDLAGIENSAPVQSNVAYCPHCRNVMANGAVLCIHCGYDSRTGRSAAAAAAPPPVPRGLPYTGKKPGKKIDYMAPTGSLVLGIVFSAIAALAASVIWVAVAWVTGFAIGYIAVLIGIAAGVGMQAGHKGQSQIGGFIAGAMTLFAIIVAKVVVLYAVLAKLGVHRSIFDLDSAKLGMYFFSPIGLLMIVIGIGAAYRTASGAVRG